MYKKSTTRWLWESVCCLRRSTYMVWVKEKALFNCRTLYSTSLIDPLILITIFTQLVPKLLLMAKFPI